MPELKVGDQFPTSVKSITEDNPGKSVDLAKELGTGKVVVLGVPGAFTPTCSATHLPSYIKDYERMKEKGVDRIVCLSVNDPFVMKGPSLHTPTRTAVSLPPLRLCFCLFSHSSPPPPLLPSFLLCSAWQEHSQATGKVRFFADPLAELAQATGLTLEIPPLGGHRFKRFSALLQDGKIEQLNVEENSSEATCSMAPKIKL